MALTILIVFVAAVLTSGSKDDAETTAEPSARVSLRMDLASTINSTSPFPNATNRDASNQSLSDAN